MIWSLLQKEQVNKRMSYSKACYSLHQWELLRKRPKKTTGIYF